MYYLKSHDTYMRKFIYCIISFSLMCFLSCGNNTAKIQDSEKDEVVVVDVNENVSEPSVADVDEIKKSLVEEIKSYGALNAYFDDDNYFVYCVDPSSLSTSGNEVAAAMFPMVEEAPGVKGVIVMDFYTKKELGRYEK